MFRIQQHQLKLRRWGAGQFALFFLALVVSTPVYAANYYVAKTGSDFNPGTEAAPFQTMQKAITVAKPGDMIYVRTGTYSGIRIYPAGGIGSSGKPGQPIVYRTYGDGPVTIDGGSGAAIWIEGQYLEFHGFKITSSSESSQWNIGIFLAPKDSPCCSGAGSNHVRFVDCEIFGCSEQGIIGNADDTEFLNLDVHHNGKSWFTDQGFYFAGSRNRIVGCKIHDNASTGIQLWHTSQDPSAVPNHTLIADNMIFGNGFAVETNDPNYPERKQYGHGIVIGSNGSAGEGNIIQNNLIFGNFPNGISLYSLGAKTQIVNNTIVANIIGINFDDQATDVVLQNNIIYANSAEAVIKWLQNNRPELLSAVNPNRHGSGLNLNAAGTKGGSVFDSYSVDNNLWDPGFPFIWKSKQYSSFPSYQSASGKDRHSLAADPQFQTAPNDFHLQSNSPAIDAGLIIPEVNTDFEGTARPQGAQFDIGAYEYSAGAKLNARFQALPASGSIPLTVNFNGSATGGTPPYSYLWDFDNSNFSSQQNPQHLFTTAGSYVVKLTVTDANSNKATTSATIVATDPAAENPSVVDIKFVNINQTVALDTIATETWYDLYLLLNDPLGWQDLSYADLWFNHVSYTNGSVANRGGNHFAASSYILSYSLEDSTIWAKETEATENWSEVTGKLGRYVDDDASEYKQNGAQKWAKARVKLLPAAMPGTWHLNAMVWDREKHLSALKSKNLVVAFKTTGLAAIIEATGPFPENGGKYLITLMTSKPVVKVPAPLYFVDSNGAAFTIELIGVSPGSTFTGELLKSANMAEGDGYFALAPEALVDQQGNKGNDITQGKYLKIDWPPSQPENVRVQTSPD